MDFDFTEEQHALHAAVRDLLADVNDADRLRAIWEGKPLGREVWQRLAALGLTGIGIPSSHGGVDGDFVDLVLVLEEAGRSALPDPLVESVVVAAPAIVQGGSDEQRDRWLPGLAAGEMVAAVRLRGQPYVLGGAEADLVVYQHDDGRLSLYAAGDFDARPVDSEDRGRRLAEVTPHGPGEALPDGLEAAGRARVRAWAGTAAVLNGISARLVDLASDYARTREQFGRPIGSFQAVQHLLADLHVAVESTRASAWYAAYRIVTDGPDRELAARIAKSAAGEAHQEVNREALQIFGGIGFTWEHDLHRWLKRGKALEAAYGTAREHRAAIADHLLEGEIT